MKKRINKISKVAVLAPIAFMLASPQAMALLIEKNFSNEFNESQFLDQAQAELPDLKSKQIVIDGKIEEAEQASEEVAQEESSEEVAQEEASQEEVAQEEASQEEVAQEESSEEEVAQEESSEEEVAQEEASEEEVAQEEASEEEVAQEEASEEEVAQEESSDEEKSDEEELAVDEERNALETTVCEQRSKISELESQISALKDSSTNYMPLLNTMSQLMMMNMMMSQQQMQNQYSYQPNTIDMMSSMMAPMMMMQSMSMGMNMASMNDLYYANKMAAPMGPQYTYNIGGDFYGRDYSMTQAPAQVQAPFAAPYAFDFTERKPSFGKIEPVETESIQSEPAVSQAPSENERALAADEEMI